jgi:hypothetical protein
MRETGTGQQVAQLHDRYMMMMMMMMMMIMMINNFQRRGLPIHKFSRAVHTYIFGWEDKR